MMRNYSVENILLSELLELKKELIKIFSFMEEGISEGESAKYAKHGWTPQADIKEDNEAVYVEVDLPGVRAEDIKVEFNRNILVIHGEKKESAPVGSRPRYLCFERSQGQFHRRIPISIPVNPDKIQALHEKGVLTIVLPKLLERRGKPNVIQVQDLESDTPAKENDQD